MKRLLYILICLLPTFLSAQTITHYSCDFEDSAENAQWTLNEGRLGPDCENKWAIGKPGQVGFGGQNGLYVYSATNKSKSWYQATQNTAVVASRKMPLMAGTYRVTLDWMAAGVGAEDLLYVLWVPEDETTAVSIANATVTPDFATDYAHLTGQATKRWQSSSFDITADGSNGKLVVLWVNMRGTGNTSFAAAVDNISIAPVQDACRNIEKLEFIGHAGQIQWEGNSDEYEIIIVKPGTTDTIHHTGITDSFVSTDILKEETVYDVYVRGFCSSNHYPTPWVYQRLFIWQRGKRCIEFLDLTEDNSGAAKCYSGNWTTEPAIVENLKDKVGKVDYGYESELSLHTIHYDKNERDARTGNQLKTVPDDEVASVRLNGLWGKTHNQTATVEYNYTVEEGSNDLMILKYAAVLEHANDETNDSHKEWQQPRFKLEIIPLDEDGTPSPVIDRCLQADFKAGFGDTQNWHKNSYSDGKGNNHPSIYWCDWQTITVSLRNYIGQTLIIRLTAYTCYANIHLGYAYFTLNCASGSLPTVSCEETDIDRFTAPDGFRYAWFRQQDINHRDTLSKAQTFILPDDADGSCYVVDCINLHNSCYFTLEANPNPRAPRVWVTPEIKSADCQNTVRFSNRSGVYFTNRVTGELMDKSEDDHLDYLSWDFGDGTTVDDLQDRFVTHEYPKTGGHFTVTLSTSMSDGACTDENVTIELDLPDITVGETESVDVCDSVYVDTKGIRHLPSEGLIHDTLGLYPNQYGCDAPRVHLVTLHAAFDTLYEARICDGETYTWPANNRVYRNIGNPLTEGSTTRHDTLRLQTQYGCDSLICLTLTIDARLTAEAEDNLLVCSDEGVLTLDCSILTGHADSVYVCFPVEEQQRGWLPEYGFAIDEPIVITLPDNIYIDRYHPTLRFTPEGCSDSSLPITFAMQYSAAMIMQRYGFLAVMDSENNGGYTFTHYAWEKDGEPLGANDFYLATGAEADWGSTYRVLLTREGESEGFYTCDFTYTPTTAIDNATGEGEFPCRVYTTLGNLYSTAHSRAELPAEPGMYILIYSNSIIRHILVY